MTVGVINIYEKVHPNIPIVYFIFYVIQIAVVEFVICTSFYRISYNIIAYRHLDTFIWIIQKRGFRIFYTRLLW